MKRTCLHRNTDEQNSCELHPTEISFTELLFNPDDNQLVKWFVRMKRIAILMFLGLSVLLVHAQKESGTVYSEHESIVKTKAMWTALVKGDKDAFLSFYADSVLHIVNGTDYRKTRQSFGGYIDWWKGVDNLKIEDDSPATPDAIIYEGGAVWVQDWLKFTGTHEKSGINIFWRLHNLYRFDKNGKVDMLFQYFDGSVFDEINNSNKTIENGAVYINHPYIVTVRKLVNAYCAENVDAMLEIYTPDATFTKSEFKADKYIGLAEKVIELKETFAYCNNITLTQIGYPDCIYYEKNDFYVVYSWWSLACDTKDGKKFSDIPVLLAHTFNKDGRISAEGVYLDSNHFE